MSKSRFPAITGGCYCGQVRYRILTSPLFCYACHCTDCQKHTGSVFGCYATIELDLVSIISPTKPRLVRELRKVGTERIHAECGSCKSELWSNDSKLMGIIELNVGTLDFPGLMEPDIHSFVESKVDWVILPPGAKTTTKGYDFKEVWPKSSLKRMEAGVKRYKEALLRREQALKEATATGAADKEGEEDHREKEGDKTPTAIDPEGKEIEDDEEFERRFKETEKALLERLENLNLKLGEKEAVKEEYLNGKEAVERESEEVQETKKPLEAKAIQETKEPAEEKKDTAPDKEPVSTST